jgi:hypothetical protein
MKLHVLILLIISSCSFAQMSKQDSIWIPLNFLIGEWKGTGEGEPGKGDYERSYHFIFNKKFIEIKNKSSYPPSDKNPKGEVHEDIGYLSYDKMRKTFILRQFHIEGFVNQYVLDSISTDGKAFIFTTEFIENIPSGWRARETYNNINDNEFTETFKLAEPNGNFEVYTKTQFHRK